MPLSLAAIHAAADRLRKGGVVAFPTETVYGLGADALNPRAVEKVFELKGRPSNNPLIVHAADEAMAQSVVTEWPGEAAALAAAFWPGPLTLVLPRSSAVPSNVTAGGPNVAVRCPQHPVAIALIEALGRPIVGPSANLSGRVSPTTAEHVLASFEPRDVMVLDGGPCRAGIESTVLSLAGAEPRILRQGTVTGEQIEAVIGVKPVLATKLGAPEGATAPLAGPGMLRSHYAPASAARMFGAGEWPAVLEGAGVGAVVISHSPGRVVRPPARVISMPADATAYAARLYAALREADSVRPDVILIEKPEGEGGVWDAIRDRLERATARD